MEKQLSSACKNLYKRWEQMHLLSTMNLSNNDVNLLRVFFFTTTSYQNNWTHDKYKQKHYEGFRPPGHLILDPLILMIFSLQVCFLFENECSKWSPLYFTLRFCSDITELHPSLSEERASNFACRC